MVDWLIEWTALTLQGDSLPFERLWSSIVATPGVVFACFSLKNEPNLVQNMAQKTRHLEIRSNEEAFGSGLEMENFEVFLALAKKSDWSMSVYSIESWLFSEDYVILEWKQLIP